VNPLQDKAIVVTGAGRGLGAAYARHAASLGARVVVSDIDGDVAMQVAKEIQAAGGRAISQATDVRDWHQAAALIERCVKEFGAIDGLVNNAGLFQMARVDELEPSDVEKILAVNIAGTIYCATHAVRHMLPRKTGSIVNITSDAQAGLPCMSAYGATKGAVASLTYTWSLELRDAGIRVNAFAPTAATRMADVSKKYYDKKGQATPYYALPAAEANAPLVCFLLSDQARDITGQVFRLDNQRLGLMTHPAIAMPLHERDAWTYEAVEEIIREDFAKRQQPPGVVGLSAAVTAFASDLYGSSAE